VLLDISAPAQDRAVARALLCASLADTIDPVALQLGIAQAEALSQAERDELRGVYDAVVQLRAARAAVNPSAWWRITPKYIAQRMKFVLGVLRSERP
jgi:hypothetical protein